MTNFPVSHARDARQFVEFAGGHGGRAAAARVVGVLELVLPLRPARDGPHVRATSADGRRRTSPTSVAHGDVLEPRRAALGRRRSPCATCCAPRRRSRPRRAVEDRSRLPVHARPPPGCRQGRRAHRAVRPAVTRRAVHADRGHRHRVDRSAARRPMPVADAHDPPAQDIGHRRGAAQSPGRSRRWPSTRGTPPTSSGRSATSTGPARRPTTPARPSAAGTAGTPRSPKRNVVLGAGCAGRCSRRVNRMVALAPAAGAAGLLNLECLPARAAPAEPDRHRAREAPPRAAAGAAAAVGGACASGPHLRRHATTTCRRRRWARSAPPSAAISSRTTAPGPVDDPNPVIVSRELLHRKGFIPARSLNLLAAAWIQFQVHDWVDHARYPLGEEDVRCRCRAGRSWRNTPGGEAGERDADRRQQGSLDRRRRPSGCSPTRPRTGGTARRSTARTEARCCAR